MVIASIILGILFILSGFCSIFAPVNTFFGVMNTFAVMMLVFGVFGIIRFFKRRALVPELIMSILSVLIAFRYLFRPGDMAPHGFFTEFDRFALFIVAGWFLIKGCVYVTYSLKTRFFNDRWIFVLIAGLMSVFLGVYSFIYPIQGAVSVGVMMGMWEIECGFDLLVFGTTTGFLMNRMEEAKQEYEDMKKEAVIAAKEYTNYIKQNLADAAAMEGGIMDETAEPAEAEVIPAETVDPADVVDSDTVDSANSGIAEEAEALADEIASEAAEPAEVVIDESEDDQKSDR